MTNLDYNHIKCPQCGGVMETQDVREFPDEVDEFQCLECDYFGTRQEVEKLTSAYREINKE